MKRRIVVWHPTYASTALFKSFFPLYSIRPVRLRVCCTLLFSLFVLRSPLSVSLRLLFRPRVRCAARSRGGRAVVQEVERHAVDDEQDRERQRQARMPHRHQASDRDREDDDLEEHPGG